MTQSTCNGHYAVQGHLRSPISLPIENPYVTSYVSITVTYLVYVALSPKYGLVVALSLLTVVSLLSHWWGWILILKIAKFGRKGQEHHSIVWREVYFDILNLLGVTHQCDGQRDEQTDGRTDRRTDRLSDRRFRALQRWTAKNCWVCPPQRNTTEVNLGVILSVLHYDSLCLTVRAWREALLGDHWPLDADIMLGHVGTLIFWQ